MWEIPFDTKGANSAQYVVFPIKTLPAQLVKRLPVTTTNRTMYPKLPSYISVYFDRRKEVLEILDSGREIMSYFLGMEKDCPLINASISTRLGKGAQGGVYTLSYAQSKKSKKGAKRSKKTSKANEDTPKDSTDYVVKVSKSELFDAKNVKVDELISSGTTVATVAEKLKAIRGVPEAITITANGGDPKAVITTHYVSVYPSMVNRYDPNDGYVCKTKQPQTVDIYTIDGGDDERVPFGEEYVYPKGSYICNAVTQPEYVIGLLCGNLKDTGKCVNFLSTFGFGMCSTSHVGKKEKGIAVRDYTFMEKITGSIGDLEDLPSKHPKHVYQGIYDSLFIQGLFAISIMNRELGVYHYDLHMGNAFYSYSEKNENKYTHLKYTVDGKDLYVPYYGYTLKVGDFGYAVKFSEPIVGSVEHTIDNKFGYAVPGWREDSYDMLLFTIMFVSLFGDHSKCAVRALIRILTTFEGDDGKEITTPFAKILKNKSVANDPEKLNKLVNIERVLKACKGDKGVTADKDLMEGLKRYYQYLATAEIPTDFRPSFAEHPLRPWELLLDEEIVGDLSQPHLSAHGGAKDRKVFRGGELSGWFEKYNDYYAEVDPMSMDELRELLHTYEDDERKYRVYEDLGADDVKSVLALWQKIVGSKVVVDEHVSHDLISAVDMVRRYRKSREIKGDPIGIQTACIFLLKRYHNALPDDPYIIDQVSRAAGCAPEVLEARANEVADVLQYHLGLANVYSYIDDIFSVFLTGGDLISTKDFDKFSGSVDKTIFKILKTKSALYGTIDHKILAVYLTVKFLEGKKKDKAAKKLMEFTGVSKSDLRSMSQLV